MHSCLEELGQRATLWHNWNCSDEILGGGEIVVLEILGDDVIILYAFMIWRVQIMQCSSSVINKNEMEKHMLTFQPA